jgi:hypothetical protein
VPVDGRMLLGPVALEEARSRLNPYAARRDSSPWTMAAAGGRWAGSGARQLRAGERVGDGGGVGALSIGLDTGHATCPTECCAKLAACRVVREPGRR